MKKSVTIMNKSSAISRYKANMSSLCAPWQAMTSPSGSMMEQFSFCCPVIMQHDIELLVDTVSSLHSGEDRDGGEVQPS